MTSRAFLFCAFALLAACSQSDVTDDADSSDSDLKIKPTGGSSAIKVSVPAGATGRVMARRQEGGTTVELTPGTAKPVAPGKYCIYTRITSATNQYDVQFETQSDCSIVVATGATVDYQLGAVKFDRPRDELVYGLDIGADSNYGNQQTRRMLTSASPIAHAKGSFEYAYVYLREYSSTRPLDSIGFTIAGGATANVDLLDSTGKWALRIVPATLRELPNPTGLQGRVEARVQSGDYSFVDSWINLAALSKPVLVRAKASSTLNLQAPTKQQLALTQPVSDKKLARLDVEHVGVTMPDGTTKDASGTVTIGTLTFPTGTGLDLLPGNYDLAISYDHPADGAKMVTNMSVDLQP